MEMALSVIEDFIAQRTPHLVVTADASAVVIAQNDRELYSIINCADLVTPDGMGILWAAKCFGCPLLERVSGADMVEKLCSIADKTGYRIFLLGSAPGIADAAAMNLKARYPNLQIAGTHHGYFKEDEAPQIIQKIRDSKPDILFTAMGIPLQEKWISRYMHEIEVPVSMGVGGTFDVLSGQVKRAPKWMQDHGLEWIYRLIKDPKKIGKVKTLPIFAMMVLKSRFAKN